MLTKPDFTAVAKSIANPPPIWLPLYLEQFSPFISSKRGSNEDYRWADHIIEQMHRSADYLIKWLPALQRMPGFGRSPDVAAAIVALTRIKNDLDRLVNKPGRGGGPRPYAQRRWCAQVMVEAWRNFRGNVEPRSIELLKACAEYWQACGQEERDAENWWRDTTDAVANPDEFVQTFLFAHETRV